jgi:hypothetical protein
MPPSFYIDVVASYFPDCVRGEANQQHASLFSSGGLNRCWAVYRTGSIDGLNRFSATLWLVLQTYTTCKGKQGDQLRNGEKHTIDLQY